MSSPGDARDDGFPDQLTDEVAREVFHRYAHRLIHLARARLDRRTRQKVDPEDVVQSVFRSFFARQAAGQFDVASWDDLWGLLVVITIRKCCRQAVAFRAARRDVRREVRAAHSDAAERDGWDVAGREPTPEEVLSLIETVDDLLRGATDAERDILLMRLQGYSPPEIARAVGGVSERKVYRVLAQARKRLQGDE